MKKSNLMTFMAVFLASCLAVIPACNLLNSGNGSGPRTIVFSASDKNETYQIYSMREDGSGVRKLTSHERFSVQPAWSPDGSRIAFATFREAPQGATTLWVMEADGSNQRPLVNHPQTGRPMFGGNPAWSPDGTKLAFDYCVNCEAGGLNHEIFVADLQTGRIDTLTRHPASDTNPVWSPDGSRIAFVSGRDYYDADTLRFRADIYIINIEGTKLEKATETGYARDPVWNPKGNTIGFRSSSSSLGLFQVEIQSGDIMKIEVNLPNRIQLFPKAWSRDGQKLLTSSRNQSAPSDYSMHIVDIENKETQSIPFGPADIMDADWRKDIHD